MPAPPADPARDPAAPRATRSRSARALALAVPAFWAAAAAALCAVKYRNFLYTDFDLAIFSQALFGVLHGRWFSSIRGMYWLGDHSSLSLLLLAPLAAAWHSPLLLPCAQALALAAGAWPLFLLARRRLGDEGAAAAFAAVWVLQPALGYLALFEFHPETLATAALLGVAAALAARRTRSALACALLAALAKEDAALPLAVMGALAALSPRSGRRAAGLALVAIALGSLGLSFLVLKPALAQRGAEYGAMYAAWGQGPASILGNLLRHPLAALGAFVRTPGDPADSLAKAQYWFHLLGPVLALSLLAPWTLLPALPVLAEHFLSYRIEQHTIVFQYTALVLPFVSLAAVDAVARLASFGAPTHAAARARRWALVLVAASIAAQVLYGPLAPDSPLRAQGPTERAWPTGADRARAAARRTLMAALPARGTIVADFPSLGPLSLRDSVHSLHHVAAGRFTFSTRSYPAPAHVAALLADFSALSAAGEIGPSGLARVARFAASRDLHVTAASGDLLLLGPGTSDTLAWLSPVTAPATHGVRFDGALELLGASVDPGDVRAGRPGSPLRIRTRWRRTGRPPGTPQVQWLVADAGGRMHEDAPRLLGYGLSDPAAWPAGAAFEERYDWVAPADLPPGPYTLALSVSWRNGDDERPALASDPAVRGQDGIVEVGRFRITAR